MAKLTYLMITSLDGYVEDEQGTFDWAAPDEEVHSVVNDLERSVGTYLLGRRMYEVLIVWETLDVEGQSPAIQDFARLWRAADKIVYSTTLEDVSSARARIARESESGRHLLALRDTSATSRMPAMGDGRSGDPCFAYPPSQYVHVPALLES